MFSSGTIKEALAKFFNLDSLAANLSGYVEARVKLLKMEVREDVTRTITKALVFGVVITLWLLFTLFFSLGIALFINQYVDGNYIGFGIMAGFYLLLFLLSLIFKKELFKFLKQVFKDNRNKQ